MKNEQYSKSAMGTIEAKRRMDALHEASKPLIEYLSKNYHPHVTAIVTSNSVELVEGLINIPNIAELEKEGGAK